MSATAGQAVAAAAAKPLRPCRLLVTTLREHGPQDRASLWALLKAKEDSSIRSKRHMKRVMRELVRRDVINAKADVSKIRDLTSGAHNKLLSSKNTPPYIWKLKHSKRYGESSSPVAEEHQ